MEKIHTLTLGALASNCYIIPAEDKKAVVIDPASSAEVLAFLSEAGSELGSIVITHGHFDHFAGVPALKKATGAEVIAPAADAEMLLDANKCWADLMPDTPFAPVVPDRTFSDGDEFGASGVKFRAAAAPGHTAGSCLLFCPTLGDVIFTGDVIFAGSVGRTDGYSGSSGDMRQSLRRIAALTGDYTLYCGHGESTTLRREQYDNYYLNMF